MLAWFVPFPFALVLARVLGFALLALPLLASFHWRLFLFWLLHVVLHLGWCLCFSVVFSFSFLSLLYCAPGTRQGIARFTVLYLRLLALFFLHPLLLIRLVYP